LIMSCSTSLLFNYNEKKVYLNGDGQTFQ
jgi:hypothetical protein